MLWINPGWPVTGSCASQGFYFKNNKEVGFWCNYSPLKTAYPTVNQRLKNVNKMSPKVLAKGELGVFVPLPFSGSSACDAGCGFPGKIVLKKIISFFSKKGLTTSIRDVLMMGFL